MPCLTAWFLSSTRNRTRVSCPKEKCLLSSHYPKRWFFSPKLREPAVNKTGPENTAKNAGWIWLLT